ncbi:hypothetical protein [Nocardioides yefusunii]|uniref:Uncharacterized protein n=1 Tax=Nocardioides yefusunii TaxID=2500546 RepID=A0ABW1QZS6_9ACTN|nr:hypothetical protein [Nocardioides yefusunii]
MGESADQDAALLGYLDDLDAWGSAMQHRERVEEVRDRSRSAYAEVTLASRLMATSGQSIALEVRGLGPLRAVVENVGTGWVGLRAGPYAWSVRTGAISLVRGLADRSVPEQAWSALARLGFAAVLRRSAEEAVPSLVVVEVGAAKAMLVGDAVVVRVGADFVEFRIAGEPGTTVVALDAVVGIRSLA